MTTTDLREALAALTAATTRRTEDERKAWRDGHITKAVQDARIDAIMLAHDRSVRDLRAGAR